MGWFETGLLPFALALAVACCDLSIHHADTLHETLEEPANFSSSNKTLTRPTREAIKTTEDSDAEAEGDRFAPIFLPPSPMLPPSPPVFYHHNLAGGPVGVAMPMPQVGQTQDSTSNTETHHPFNVGSVVLQSPPPSAGASVPIPTKQSNGSSSGGLECGKRLVPYKKQFYDYDLDERNLPPFIARGHSTTIDQWPWQVFIRINDMYLCGGVLIDARHVLTAAHCLEASMTVSKLKVLMGKTVTAAESQESEHGIEKVAIHPNFGKRSQFDSDIAVLRLRASVNFSSALMPICMPPRAMQVKDGAVCTATGYGDTKGTGERDDALKQAAVNVLSNEQCKSENVNLQKSLTNNMLCAGALGGGEEACNGDPGSPLACETESGSGLFVLHGLMSFGVDCKTPQLPGVYVRVANFFSWIQRAIAKWR